MTSIQLYKFITKRECEYHWENFEEEKDVVLFVNVLWIDEFNELFDYSFFDDGGFPCIMYKDYFCFRMNSICEYYNLSLEEIFKKGK